MYRCSCIIYISLKRKSHLQYPFVHATHSLEMDVLKGDHCYLDDCQQFDFLPFTCDGCNKVFCLHHRSQNAHKCTAAPEMKNVLPICPICRKYVLIKSGESVDRKLSQHIRSRCKQFVIDPQKEKIAACSFKKCKSRTAPCECNLCHRFFCAQHRLADDHLCSKGSTGQKRPKQRRGSKIFNQFRAKLKRRVDPSKARLRMKQDIVGDKNITRNDRFYMKIHFGKSLKKKPLNMFFDKKKTLGRILDEICDERNIKNKNHIASARQLVLVCVRTESKLPLDVGLYLMEPQFMSGDTVLLQYEDEF